MKKWFYFVLAYFVFCTTVLFHEWGHSLAAVLFGVKENMFDIHYSFLPFLMGISEKVDYQHVATLANWLGVVVAGAGLLVNFISALVFLLLLQFFKKSFFVVTAFFFVFFNISAWCNYTTIRVLFLRDDMAHMVQFGFPYPLLVVLGFFSSAFLLYLLFGPARRQINVHFALSTQRQKVVLNRMIILFIVMQLGQLYNALMMY